MRKSIKKLLGTALTAAMCLSLLPVQTVKAEENEERITLSEEQAKELLFGTWAISEGEEGIVEKITLGEQAVIDVYGDVRTYYFYEVNGSYTDKTIEVYATYVTDTEKHAASLEDDKEKGTYHKDGDFRMSYNSDSEGGVFAIMMGSSHSADDDDYDDLEKYFSYKILENGEAVTGEDLLKQVLQEDVTEETDTETEEEDDQNSLTEEQIKDIIFGTWKLGDGEEITFGEQFEYGCFDPMSEETEICNFYYYESSFDYYDEYLKVTYTTDIEKHIEGCWSDDANIPHVDFYVRGYCPPTDDGTFESSVYGYRRFSMEDFGLGEHVLECKVLENGETATMLELIRQALAGASKEEVKEDVTTEVEEDTNTEVKEDVTTETEDAKTDNKEESKTENKTTGTRELQEGESVYIVKKGDCLWGIARTLLGDGRKYTELYTRNNDIVEKATLIFPGQEIIVPAK